MGDAGGVFGATVYTIPPPPGAFAKWDVQAEAVKFFPLECPLARRRHPVLRGESPHPLQNKRLLDNPCVLFRRPLPLPTGSVDYMLGDDRLPGHLRPCGALNEA